MFYEFNTTSLVVDFINQLLASTPLPVYDTVQAGDIILLGRYYIYNQYVIKCTKTGTFNPDALDYVRDEANYVLVQDGIITYENYIPSADYYSADMHRRLARYISRLKATTGLNLFPFYNCYGGREITGIKIDSFKKDPLTCGKDHVEGVTDPNDSSTWQNVVVGPSTITGFTYLSELSGGYEVTENSTDRLVAVPVKFGHTYTISVECPSRVSGRCFFLNDSGNLLTFDDGYANIVDPSSYLGGSIFQKGATRFGAPFLYTVPTIENIEDADLLSKLYAHEVSLYLVLQIPKSCGSAISVLDGDFVSTASSISNLSSTDRKKYTEYDQTLSIDTNASTDMIRVIPRLLSYNTGISYAFTDRLVEYLSESVINSEDRIAGNIRRIQQTMELRDFQFGRYDKQWNTYGSWHNTLSEALARFLKTVDYQSWFKFDQDGNVNKDVEYLLARFGGYNA